MSKLSRGIIVILVFIYIIASLSINNVATFTIQPKICPLTFCVSGLPINIQLEFDKNISGSVEISSKSTVEKEKSYDFTGGKLSLDIPTENNLPTNVYNLNIKLSSSWWNLILDPIRFFRSSLIGKDEDLEFRYPDISVVQKGEKPTKEGIHYDQINLQNNDKQEWNCKIRLSVSERSEVSPSDFHSLKSSEHRDFYDTEPKMILLSGPTYGFTNIDIKSPSCKDRIAVDISPVCIINNIEIELLSQKYSKETPIPDNRC